MEKKADEAKKATEMKAEKSKKASEMEADEAMKAIEMNTQDDSTNKKETAVKTLAQKMADLKMWKGARPDAETNTEGNKDDDSNNEDNGIADSAFAQ